MLLQGDPAREALGKRRALHDLPHADDGVVEIGEDERVGRAIDHPDRVQTIVVRAKEAVDDGHHVQPISELADTLAFAIVCPDRVVGLYLRLRQLVPQTSSYRSS